jgi:uncharacterized protein YjbI with pentapeptide repeats
MKYWQAWMACGLLMSLPAAAQADIFRWDNGELIPGTEGITPGPGVDLSSWNSPQRNLHYADFSRPFNSLDLTGANFSSSWLDDSQFPAAILKNANLSGTNLTDASLSHSNLTNANLSGAVVTGAQFVRTTSGGFTKEQLYSTASHQQRDLSGINLFGNDLTGWDFSGQDLTGAEFGASQLSSANLSGAVITGVRFDSTTSGGFTQEQLYSTASYQQKNLRDIDLTSNNLTGWDFSGQDLTGAYFYYSMLTNADLSGANLTYAQLYNSVTLTNANLAGAIVTGAALYGTHSFTREHLYSTASYQQKNLRAIGLSGIDLAGWDFSGQDLTGASLTGSRLTNANLSGANLTNARMGSSPYGEVADTTLTNANLAGAIVAGANLYNTPSFTREHLYSTASYQQRNLRRIRLGYNNLTGWDFSGQDLTGASFISSRLTNTNFSFADLRGALMPSEPIQLARNTIREFGAINGLHLAAGETLVVRDADIGITVNDSMNIFSGGTLELVLGDADWGSTIAVAANITPDLGGTLRIRFADQANLVSMSGTTFDFFHWPAVLDTNNRFDAIELPPGTRWDLNQLYLTVTATLTAIPEPSAVLLSACGTAAWILGRALRQRVARGRCEQLARIMQEKPRNTRNTRKAPNFKHVKNGHESTLRTKLASSSYRNAIVCIVFRMFSVFRGELDRVKRVIISRLIRSEPSVIAFE